MTDLRLAHLSDPHLPPPDAAWGELRTLKQQLAAAAWRRKRGRHSPNVLAAMVADIAAQAPDHVALTGDLVNFAAPAEFAGAAAWLEGIAPPDRLTLSPGNHDALAPSAVADASVRWRPWMEDEPGEFPRLRVRGGVALINLSSATPTPPLLAQGRLGAEQLARLDALLEETARAGLHRVLLIHHPVGDGAASWRKALTDAAALRSVLALRGAELVLHGHLHAPTLGRLAGPGGATIPVLGAPSASSPGLHDSPARWTAIEIGGPPGAVTVRVIVRGLRRDGTVGELGRYRLAGAPT